MNQARNIQSPWSGATVRPVIKECWLGGNEIRREAHYICPSTGRFITKIVLEVRKVNDAGTNNS